MKKIDMLLRAILSYSGVVLFIALLMVLVQMYVPHGGIVNCSIAVCAILQMIFIK